MLKKILWSSVIVFLIMMGYIMFYFALVVALPILPVKYVERVVNRTVISSIEHRTFPEKLLDVLSKNPKLITPNMYDAISKMYVISQDSQTNRMKILILEVNKNELFCHIIPDLKLSNNEEEPSDYAGQRIAEAIGQPWRCK